MTTEKVRAESERARSESEKVMSETFDFYSRMSRVWWDSLNSWTRLAQGQPWVSGRTNVESWSRPYWDYMQEWGKAFGNFSNIMMRTTLPQFAPVKDISDTTVGFVNGYIRIYDTWFRSVNTIAREGYDIFRKLSAREEIDIDKYMDAVRNSYFGVIGTITEVFKDTPFAGIKQINDAVRESLDSAPEQQRATRDFIEELFNFNVKALDLASLTLRQITETTSNLGKGNLSGNGYDKLVDAYSKTLKRTYENLRLPATLPPGSEELTDDITNWVKANIELYVSWLDMIVKQYQGVNRSYWEIYRTAGETASSGKTTSVDESYRLWTDAYSNSMDTMIKGSRFYESASGLVEAYTNWLNSSNKLYRTLMTPPYSTKEDLDVIWKEVEKLKRPMEARSKAAESRSRSIEQRSSFGARRSSRAAVSNSRSKSYR